MKYQCIIAATDPWANYTDQYGKKLPVPEPSTYGLMMTGSLLMAIFLRKKFKR